MFKKIFKCVFLEINTYIHHNHYNPAPKSLLFENLLLSNSLRAHKRGILVTSWSQVDLYLNYNLYH